MKKLVFALSLALMFGVFTVNAQEKTAAKKPATEQTAKKPAEKKEVKKKPAVKKTMKAAPAKKEGAKTGEKPVTK
jgi:hypothetical protein